MGFKQLNPPGELYKNILARIDSEKRRTARIKLAFFGFTAMASLVGLFPALQYAAGSFYQSGFYSYFSLIFTDSDLLIMYWREFVLALIESVPVLEVVLVLSIILILSESVKITFKNTKVVLKLT